jgi:hypothetical protein
MSDRDSKPTIRVNPNPRPMTVGEIAEIAARLEREAEEKRKRSTMTWADAEAEARRRAWGKRSR